MKLAIGISTMNDGIYPLIDNLNGINKYYTIIISHQITEDKSYNFTDFVENIIIVANYDKGLSKSRNVLLQSAICNKVDFLIISDDDVQYDIENLKKLEAFIAKNGNNKRHYQFKSMDHNGNDRKKYPVQAYTLSRLDILKVSSIEMCINISLVKDAFLKFDEKFGLGAKYPVGEEAVFLSDARRCKNEIFYVPLPVTIHPVESTGLLLFTVPLMIKSRGALFVRCFGKVNGLFLLLAFWLRKFMLRRKGKGDVKTFDALKLMISGYINNDK